MTLSIGRSSTRSSTRGKPFKIGTLGWTADDLDDPRIERQWEQGRYEIVEGVLTAMPPAQLDTSPPLLNLVFILKRHVRTKKLGGIFGIEVDVIINKLRVAVADAIYLTDEQKKKQAELYSKKPNRKPKVRFGRVMLAPALIVEVVSHGHEAHDRETKFGWYAGAGVEHYWILDPFQRSLECFRLSGKSYKLESSGRESAKVRQSLFPSLTIPLTHVWEV